MTTYKLIVNPTSGRGAGQAAIAPIEEKLRGYKLPFDLVTTERPWHACELAQQAARDGHEVVVAVGGDGTANEVLNGILQAQREGIGSAAMGIIGVGRGNDLAFGMGIPFGIDIGCEILRQDRRQRVDVGMVRGGDFPEGRYFGNGVGVGFDAVVGFEALKLKRLSGFPSYIVAALKTIFLYYHAPRVRVEFEERSMEFSALMVSVMNGRRMGGGFFMAPEAENDDGSFDLCIAEEVSRPKIFALIFRFMQGSQGSHPAIHMIRSSRASVTALDGSLPAHADGETLCTQGTQLVMEVIPRALEIVTLEQSELT